MQLLLRIYLSLFALASLGFLFRSQLLMIVALKPLNNSTLNEHYCVNESHLKIRLEKPGPITALASAPGSGNTWTRHLIHLATGHITGSRYKDSGETSFWTRKYSEEDRFLIAIKDHFFGKMRSGVYTPHHGKSYERAVVIVRNPLDAALSQFNFENKSGKTKYLPVTYFKENHRWTSFVKEYITYWNNFHDFVANNFNSPDTLCLLEYEKLTKNAAGELSKCLRFLGFDTDEHSRQCLQKHGEGHFHRKSRPTREKTDIFNLISKAERLKINQTWTEVLDKLRRL